MADDLRDWIEKVDKVGELQRISGADWNLEIGGISLLNGKRNDGPAVLFDDIKDYPTGFRVLTCSTSKPSRLALTFDFPATSSEKDLLVMFREKFAECENSLEKFPPQIVKSGPVLENVRSGEDVDLFEFPVPKLHEEDGGRYIGTADTVITRDPDNGEINLGTYRIMVHDKNTTALYISPGKHGRIHVEKYHSRGEPCPVAVSIGQHPLLFRIASIEASPGAEYNFVGAARGEPVEVIREEITGLPIPARQ